MKKTIRRLSIVGASSLVAALALSSCTTSEPADSGSAGAISGDILFYDTSGGVVYEAEAATLFADFTDDTGVSVTDDYNEAATKFFASAEAGSMPWSLMLFPTVNDAATAAADGLLEKIDTSIVPVDKLVDGTYNEYGIEVGTFGMVLAWDDDAYPDTKPTEMADLWDLDTFPGKRCFFNNPQYGWTLEAALLADGVAADDLYPLDVDRALEKLDEIKNDITWWTSGAQSIESFENGSCDIGILWANRAFTALDANGFPMNITWNEAGYSNSVWSIPAGAPNAAAAQELLAHVINNTEGQIAFASVVPTPIPASVKALSPTDFPEQVQAFLPVGSNVDGSVLQDSDYYLESLTEVLDQFNRWVGQ
ncbi:extracellular solute-binding protein [Salinibacterium sp. NSLL150]|uniref:extracellular solute-binding protein n=1 Tax=unclassified Salinibacterium TaxID=2632331 RepID=UPI0018CD3B6F|nr:MULTISPECIES: extracellular solute-binding protein [unclassified Salinibacterium]MBH0097523.1 extracellular solute-binding protein [Salinibacterium sp. NSLL35]MBH0100278.1 extracellular solute-binding protein [Salinibacterium sp. NSLL150]MBH0103037.1 extracellular solute-binding protein [Salinibacterium sp. NSLL16]MBH0105798.1 extracellular solute-binding protein [Salinibacterium sp. NSLL17]